ncbi:hypothetical protein ABIC71_000915 [Herbaspirillum seropedicae]|uniref:hypothetical protein n=1 Tax=Herbaspirillum seropedicae TaxID=964 RepID=UPI00339423E7
MIIRQQLMGALASYLAASPELSAQVGRSLARAFSEEEGDQLVIHRGKEVPDLDMEGDGQRQCDVLVSVVSRADEAEVAADAVMAVAHPMVMGFADPRILHIEEVEVDEPRYASADYKVCLITTRYRIFYRVEAFAI